jgi:hypothetical protein
MRRLAVLLFAPLGLVWAADANAVIYLGNPVLGFRVDRPQHDYVEGSVTLEKVVVHHCAGGSTTYTVDATVDPVAGHTLSIDAGNHCGVTFHWDSTIEVEGPSYVVEHTASTTSVLLDSSIAPKLLAPCSVTSGSMSGSCPWLLVYVD